MGRIAKKDQAPDDTPPSESVDRKEFVILLGETTGRKTQVFLPILRTDAAGFFGFGEFDSSGFHGFEGRYAEMLPPKTPNKETRKINLNSLASTVLPLLLETDSRTEISKRLALAWAQMQG